LSKIVQEKFQVNYPSQDNDDASDRDHAGGGWVTDAEARAKKNTPGREGLPGGDPNSRFLNNARFYQSLPPGMDIEDQEMCDIRKMSINTAGNLGDELARGDRTQDLSSRVLSRGFDRKMLRPTDDMYTREHNDAFYDTVEVDGVEGFVERNNMLDRM
jgi:hypothetical protein